MYHIEWSIKKIEMLKKFVNLVLILLLLINIGLISFFAYRYFTEDDNEYVEEKVDEAADEDNNNETFFGVTIDYIQSESKITSASDINLRALDGSGNYYAFDYDNQYFEVYYTYDNWTIYNSYRVRNRNDMIIICKALIDINPVHGRDRVSYRTPEDMAYEWMQHNYAYELLPESGYKQKAKDVDFDPDDQGKSLEELYTSRTQ